MRNYAWCGTFLSWFALVLQLYLMLAHLPGGHAPLQQLLRYFSFFTILTNFLVALIFTSVSLGRMTFFSRPAVQASAVVYITVVALGYHLLLRKLWNPQGAQWVADTLLHTILPLGYVVYWLVFSRCRLPWKVVFSWLLYPLVYLGYAMARGWLTGVYPYPFLNVNLLGYVGVLTHVAVFLAGFLELGLLVVLLGRGVRPMDQEKPI